MIFKFKDYSIKTDARQFVVGVEKRVQDENEEEKEYTKPLAYCTTFEQALNFLPQQVIRDTDDLKEIKELLIQIKENIKTLSMNGVV